jgi:hypothetical protein
MAHPLGFSVVIFFSPLFFELDIGENHINNTEK